MKKQTYIHPAISILHTTPEGFICLSVPIGQGGGPGGGGDAKGGFFDEEDEENEQGMAGYSPWED